MLKSALNVLTRMHSREATLKRYGSVYDSYSPCRITPSNYFRFLRGPEYTSIPGKEFIIPIDSLVGHFTQTLVFAAIPTTGTFKITYGTDSTTDLNFDDTSTEIETALKLLPGFSNITVTGNFTSGFLITMLGVQNKPVIGQLTDSTLDTTGSFSSGNSPWADPIKKADRILDGTRVYTIDEIMEMPDLGGQTMAYRCRVD